MSQPSAANIKVICRFRPFNEREKAMGVQSFYEVSSDKTISVKQPKNEKADPLNFNFDRVFDQNSRQDEVYQYTARSIIDSVLQGFNGTVLAYGQTSSGKTFTMEGLSIEGQQSGVIPRMVRHVFKHIEDGPSTTEFILKVSIVQLYNQKLRDLLDQSKPNLKIRSDKIRGIYLQNVTQTYIIEPQEVFDMLKTAQQSRAIAATNMNENSSRSHMLFMLTVHQTNNQDLSSKTGKLYLVDLAGSQKISKTGAEGKVLQEAKKINMSLTTLGKVINTLTDGKSSHIPYRESKLTRVLQESLGGNSKTALIVTCSPHQSNCNQTVSTLRFGISAKNIKNKPKINKEMTVPELQLLLEKAQTRATQRHKRVEELENYIKNELRAKIPSVQGQQSSLVDDVEEAEDQKFRLLQEELELEKSTNSMQAQKLNNLKKDYTLVCERIQSIEKQNENLLSKIIKLQVNEAKEIQSSSSVNTDLLQQIFSMTSDTEIKDIIQKSIAVPEDATESVSLLRDLKEKYQLQKDKRKKAEELALRSEKDVKKKLTSLENNIQQLTSVYHDLYVQQSKWKIENTTNLRRLEKKNKRIADLQKIISDLKEDLTRKNAIDDRESSEEDEDSVKQRQINSLRRYANNHSLFPKSSQHSKVVKPIRGGHKAPKQ